MLIGIVSLFVCLDIVHIQQARPGSVAFFSDNYGDTTLSSNRFKIVMNFKYGIATKC